MLAQFYSEVIQLCQNCPATRNYGHCNATVVPDVVTSEACYNHLNASRGVRMVSFDQTGKCWAFETNDCIKPRFVSYSNLSDHGTWTARLSNNTGNDLTSLFD